MRVFLSLRKEMKNGLRVLCRKRLSGENVAIDTWGVDFGLIDKMVICWAIGFTFTVILVLIWYMSGCLSRLIKLPIMQRKLSIKWCLSILLFQLYSIMKQNQRCTTPVADKLLFIPDLFSYFIQEQRIMSIVLLLLLGYLMLVSATGQITWLVN